jgi:hypothetical protein
MSLFTMITVYYEFIEIYVGKVRLRTLNDL